MCDWNNNGKYDMQDAFIDYHIYNSISGNMQSENSSEDDGDLMVLIGIVLLIFGIIMILV